MKGRVFVLLLLFSSCAAAAQFNMSEVVPRVRVHVQVAGGNCGGFAHVTLASRSGARFDAITNDKCEADFFNVRAGSYDVDVSGQNYSASSTIELMSVGPAEFELSVSRSDNPRNDADHGFATAASAFISASDLGIPGRARRELEKANELINERDFKPAIRHLNKAISIYPSFAIAYNNLGVAYAKLHDQSREREALQKAISLNDHFALAYVNVGRMNVAANDFPDAESMLVKGLSLDPTDAAAWVLLSWSYYMDHHFDQAIDAGRKAHGLDKPHAFAHRVAARSYEQNRDGAGAIAELELYLQEEPAGPRADAARHELEVVKAVYSAMTAGSR